MRSKTIIFLFMGFSALLQLPSCNNSNNKQLNQFDAKDTLAELDTLLTQLNSLESEDCNNLDEIVTLNEKIRGIVEGIKSPKEFNELLSVFNGDKHKIGFLVSEDELLGVFSWQTKMDCLGHSIKNIALYISGDKLVASSLYGKPMIYEQIALEKLDSNKTIYLLSTKATKQNTTVTKGYTIINGVLMQSEVRLSKRGNNRYAISAIEKETDSITSH
nr:hypothetical protein [uncultured Allomuricauda sp.]